MNREIFLHYLLKTQIKKNEKQKTLEYYVNMLYNIKNILIIYVVILLLLMLTYEILPLNEEFVVVTCTFLAFGTIDKFTSHIIHTTFQHEQQLLITNTLKRSYEVFFLCLMQKKFEKKSLQNRKKIKLFVYSLLHNFVIFTNFFDFLLVRHIDFEEQITPTQSVVIEFLK